MAKTSVINKRSLYENILDECTKGNFVLPLDYVISNLEGKIPTRLALNILISCCNACAYKQDDISEEYLLNLLRCILPFLRNLNETDFVSYLQSMYQVIKFLIYKNSLEEIIAQIEDMLILDFKPEQLSKKCIDSYHNIAKILHNLIVKSSSNNNENSHELLFKISILMLRICAKFLALTTAINLVYGGFSCLIYMKVAVKHQIQYYKEFLNLFDFSQVKPKCETIFRYIQNFSSTVLNNILIARDYEKAREFINYVSNELRIILNYDEYMHFHQVLRYFLIIKLNDKSTEIKKCLQSLLKLDKIFEKSDCRKELNYNIYKLLKTTKDYYVSCPKEWEFSSEELQFQIIKFITKVKIFNSSGNDTGESIESIENIIYNELSYCMIAVVLIKISVNKNTNSSDEYHRKYVDMLKKTLFTHSEFMKLTNNENCKAVWIGLAIEIHNTAVNLYRQQNKAAASLYFHLMQSFLFSSAEVHSTVFLKYTSLLCTCATSLSNIFSEDCKKALAYISLAVFLSAKNEDSLMSKWITLKYGLKNNEDIQKLNLVSALELLREDIPELKLNNTDKVYLLKVELEYYKKKWKSKIPILCALKELINLSDTEQTAEVIANIFIDMDIPNHDEIRDVVADVLETYEKQAKSGASRINLAILYYIHYKSCNKLAILNNAEFMKKANFKSEPNNLDPSDPTEECDFMSSFESLRVDLYNENLKNLNNSLDILNLLAPDLGNDNFEGVKLLQLYNLLLEISFEFKLLRYSRKVVKALELALKLAQVLNDVPCILKCIGFMIEHVDMKGKRFQDLVDLADKLIDDKNLNESSNYLELSILYYISKSKVLLYHNYQESFNIFKKAKHLFESAGGKNGIIKCQLFLLSSKFTILPCNLEAGIHKNSLHMNAFSATEIMFDEYKMAQLDDPYQISVLIQASEELIKLYHYLKCPREVRMYTKEILLLTQKLVLPLNSATFLMYLAHADMLLNYQDECEIKIKDMARILNLNKAADKQPKHIYTKQSSSSSPNFQMQSFQLPFAAVHENTCDCYYCDCSEYQILVLEKLRLSALVNAKENNVTLAKDFFQGALKLYEYYSGKSSSKTGFFVPDFLSSYGYVLLNYSSHLWRIQQKDEARCLNTKLLELMEAKKLLNMHLYNEALVQKLGYLTENIIPEPVPELQTDMDNLKVSDNNYLSKTPESKQSKVSFIVEHSQFNSPPKLTVRKCLPFTFSPSETANSKKPVIDLTRSPDVLVYKEEKRTRQKINSAVEKTPKRPPVAAASGKKTRPKKPIVLEEVSTVVSSFSSSSFVDKSLKNRTKLLTEKLKKKADPSVSDIENQLNGNTQSGSRSYPARKNLMNDLAEVDADQKVGKGAIRKYTRSKK